MTHRFPRRTWLCCLATLALVGCAASGPKRGLVRAEDVLANVERIYVECELSNGRSRAALEALRAVASGQFAGDGTESYVALVGAVEASSIQCEVLAETLDPLRSASLAYFASWQTSLSGITSTGLRERSAGRMSQAHARCDAVEEALQSAIRTYVALDLEVRDCATFLGNDLSAGSLAEIRADLARLDEQAAQLDLELDTCLTAAQEYLRSAALPGQDEAAAGPIAAEGAERS